MFSSKYSRFLLQICAFVTICSISRAVDLPSSGHYQETDQNVVIEEESRDGACSYTLTVPKTQCSCNCAEEFRTHIEQYESRLGVLEKLVDELLAERVQEPTSYSRPSSSFRLFESWESSLDMSPVETNPTSTTTRKLTTAATTTPEPVDELTTLGHELNEESSVSSERPIVLKEENEMDETTSVNISMTAEVGEIPLRVNDEGVMEDGMSGFVVLPSSAEQKNKSSVSRSDPPPPIEASKQFEDIFSNPPAPNPFPSEGIELNLAAHKSNSGELSVVTEEASEEDPQVNGEQEAFNSPQQLLKPIEPKTEEEDEDSKAAPEEEERAPPGFVDGMETAAGYAGEFNRPQWKQLERFLVPPKTNSTTKRERPLGMERVPSCERDGCACLTSKGKTQSGIYYLPNVPLSGKRGNLVEMFCDLETKDGGWTVIQRRQNGSANFYRNWNHYAHGFGYLDDSFWIGNRMLHAITRRFHYEIRVEFTDWEGKTGYADYDSFYVGPEEDNFRLSLGKFTDGNRGNAFSYHNGSMFSTLDRDNDKSPGECAVLRQSGFWFKNCNRMNPNGRWIPFADGTGLNGAIVTWGTWSRHLFTYSLKDFRMMIRPTSRSDYA